MLGFIVCHDWWYLKIIGVSSYVIGPLLHLKNFVCLKLVPIQRPFGIYYSYSLCLPSLPCWVLFLLLLTCLSAAGCGGQNQWLRILWCCFLFVAFVLSEWTAISGLIVLVKVWFRTVSMINCNKGLSNSLWGRLE